ncbi:MAG: AbrB/MazE/SpoVT family DNA-binding domain-containing protein [Candidatus Njordarchaeales archaeon]
MLRRKLVKLGKSSLVVSLPKEWINNLNLNAGDEVSITYSEDGSLIITPAKFAMRKRILPLLIDITNCDEPHLIERLIIAAYVVGKDPIIIKSERGLSSSQLREIRTVINNIRGLEIVKEDEKNIVLRSFLDPTKYPLTGLIKRIINLVQAMLEFLIEALRRKNKSYLEELLYIEEEVDRLYFSTLRQIFLAAKIREIAESIGIKRNIEIMSLKTIIKVFELLADDLAKIARSALNLIESGENILETNMHEFINFLADISSLFNFVSKMILYNNASLTNELLNKLEDLLKEYSALDTLFATKIKNEKVLKWLKEALWGLMIFTDMLRIIAEISINIIIDRAENKFEC